MTNRRGVSLVEVMVAALLLALGIAGTMHALAASTRLRADADRREAVVGLMLDRLAWFEAGACASGDSSGVERLANGAETRWRVAARDSLRELVLEGRRRADASVPTRVVTQRVCG